MTTATEYTGSQQDLVQNANKNQIPIETALIGILRAMLWAAKNLLGAPVDRRPASRSTGTTATSSVRPAHQPAAGRTLLQSLVPAAGTSPPGTA